MNNRRLTTAGLALVATFSFGVAGCGTADGDGTTPASGGASNSAAQLAPADELRAAVNKLNDETVKVTVTGGVMNGNGSLDPAAKKSQMTLDVGAEGQTMKMASVVVGDDLYLKMAGLPGMPKKWMHLKASDTGANSLLNQMFNGDLAGTKNLEQGMVEVRRDGEGSFKGTLDMTKAPQVDQDSIKVLGDKATAIPFTAKVNDQGRLTEFVMDTATIAQQLGSTKSVYSDHGQPVTIEKPAAAETVEAPDELVRMFNK